MPLINFRKTAKSVDGTTIYRSASYDFWTDLDFANIAGCSSFFEYLDLRSPKEKPIEQNRIPNCIYKAIPIDQNSDPFFKIKNPNETDYLSWYQRTLSGHREAFASCISIFSKSESSTIVFGCTAGKDRTGILATLLMLIIGEPREKIIAAHETSYELLTQHAQALQKITAHKEITIQEIRRRYLASCSIMGSFLSYLISEFGDIQKLSEFLEIENTTLNRLRARYKPETS